MCCSQAGGRSSQVHTSRYSHQACAETDAVLRYGAGCSRAPTVYGAHLEGAILWRAHLEGADIERAHLEGAILRRAHLDGARLATACLDGANLGGAELKGADLTRADLEGVINLTVEQLATVKTLYPGYLDPPLLEQIQQQYPHLLEKPQN